ncbi:MAG: DUF5777 family beta-barrel protein [Chitinophagaceae bacterium]|nr:DUF5777 family beta-barrel protein [Chitinophagaceae bacterium]
MKTKQILSLFAFLVILFINANSQNKDEKKPVQAFSGIKTINARTTELIGKGKLDFNVTHNFGDIAGSNGGIRRFFGLDNAADIRIAFTMGLGQHFDATVARAKGAGPQQQLYELAGRYRILQQRENDPSHPVSIVLFANMVVAASPGNPFPDQDNSYDDLGERMSNVFQVIVSRKIGNVSLQLNPTFLSRGYCISYDMKNMFALGGALRFPVGGRVNVLLDYFYPFRSESSKNAFLVNDNLKFYNPLGVGFEVLTAGHIFRLNFTNATEILENRFIPRTITSWGKGQYRWGFTISRKFTVWRSR